MAHFSLMRSDRNIALVSTLIVSVTLLFFFPVSGAGFQASHGPTSTLKEHDRSLTLEIVVPGFPMTFQDGTPVQMQQSFLIYAPDDARSLLQNPRFSLLRC